MYRTIRSYGSSKSSDDWNVKMTLMHISFALNLNDLWNFHLIKISIKKGNFPRPHSAYLSIDLSAHVWRLRDADRYIRARTVAQINEVEIMSRTRHRNTKENNCAHENEMSLELLNLSLFFMLTNIRNVLERERERPFTRKQLLKILDYICTVVVR